MATYTMTDGRTVTLVVLANQYGWRLTYKAFDNGPRYDTVIVSRSYKREPTNDLVMTREEARRHYATQLRAGFKRVDSTPDF